MKENQYRLKTDNKLLYFILLQFCLESQISDEPALIHNLLLIEKDVHILTIHTILVNENKKCDILCLPPSVLPISGFPFPYPFPSYIE